MKEVNLLIIFIKVAVFFSSFIELKLSHSEQNKKGNSWDIEVVMRISKINKHYK